ncbi:ABC transporter permease [Anaerolineales bacterium HSG24]|nr:ABC transporter permease [Anaerolineales bacterium HSG24]
MTVAQPVSFGDEYEEQSIWQRLAYVGRLLRRDRGGMIGSILFILIVLTAVFAPMLAPHDPLKQNLKVAKQPPGWTEEGTWEHPLGTDNLGRDMLSRIIYGTRVSLTVGFFGVLIASILGLISGLIAGYRGGLIDNTLMAVINLFLAIPYLVFVVVIASILGRSLLIVILIFGITDSPLFARVTRGEVLRIRQSGYVESARSAGASDFRIQFDHILPNLIGPLITLATFEMSAMIFYEAGLGFLGLSVPPSVPSWGNMLAQGRKYLDIYPWIAIYPGIAIAITALSFNLLGDWLRDVLDPRLRRSR